MNVTEEIRSLIWQNLRQKEALGEEPGLPPLFIEHDPSSLPATLDPTLKKNLLEHLNGQWRNGYDALSAEDWKSAIQSFESIWNAQKKFQWLTPITDNKLLLTNLGALYRVTQEREKFLSSSLLLIQLLERNKERQNAWRMAHQLWLEFPNHPKALEALEPIAAGDEYPENVVIEVTVRCNLKCPGCEGRGDGKSIMKMDDYRRLIDELSGKVQFVVLHNLGESMLHPNIVEIMKIAADAGLKPVIDTNGSVKMDHEGIVRSGLHEMTFALDGLDQETYQQYRINGKLDLVKKNMRALADAKIRLGSEYPIITAKCIVMKTNEHQVPMVKEVAKELGADRVRFTQFSALGNPGDDSAYLDKFTPSDTVWLRHQNALMQERETFKPVLTSCSVVSVGGPVVRWDGHVVPCCNDNFSRVVYGNAFAEGGFYEAWNNPKAKAFRVQAVLDAQKNKLCSKCFWAKVPTKHAQQVKNSLLWSLPSFDL